MIPSSSTYFWRAWIVIGALTAFGAAPAYARGFLYRDAATGRWTKLASVGDPLPPGSAFASETFAGFYGRSRATIASVGAGTCGPNAITLAVFSARVSLAAKNTGIFLFDAATASVHDVVIEFTPTPLGGTWGSFFTTAPQLAIDADACVAHVVFLGQRSGGGPSGTNTAVFEATFTLPGLTFGGVAVLAQEGITEPGAPFPAGALLSRLDTPSAAAVPGAGVFTALRIGVSGGGVTADDDTGILAVSSGGTSVLLREGDATCVPPWPGAGPVYDEFSHNPITVSAVGGGSVATTARSRGGSPSSDSAIVLNTGGCSGSTLVVASEGGPSPESGTYVFPPGRFFATSASGDAVFYAIYTTPFEITRALIRSSTGFIVRQNHGDTVLGPNALVRLSPVLIPSMNAASDVVFSASTSVSGITYPVFFSSGSGDPAEVVTFGGRNPQIDDLGNMTAYY